jgi:phage tail sheath protein FI
MPSVLSYPGVYIEEVPSGVRAIVGVATSIGAFIGRTARGPINDAVRVTDRATFLRTFGGRHPSNDLAASLNLFFENGGTDCYVVRIAHNALASDLTLKAIDGTNVLVAAASDEGVWGNDVRLLVDYATVNPDDTFNLRVLEEANGQLSTVEEHTALSMDPQSARFAPAFVTDSSRLINLTTAAAYDPVATTAAVQGYSESRRPLSTAAGFAALVDGIINGSSQSRFEISLDEEPFTPINLAGPAFAGSQGAIATEIGNRIRTQLPAGLDVNVTWEQVYAGFRVLRIASASAGRHSSVRIRPSAAQDLAVPLMLGVSQGGVEVGRFAGGRPAPSGTLLSGSLNTLAEQQQDAFDQITVDGQTINLAAILQTTAAGDRWHKDANTPAPTATDNNDGLREKLRLLAEAISTFVPAGGTRTFRADMWGNYRLAIVPTDGNHNRQIQVSTSKVAGGGFDLGTLMTPNTSRYALGNSGLSPFQQGPGTMGRDDDGNAPDINDYLGDPQKGTGMHSLDNVDLFNLMVLPMDSEVTEPVIGQVAINASNYCADHRAFLLVDAPSTWTDKKTHRLAAGSQSVDSLRQTINGKNSAAYYPRLLYNEGGRRRLIGPAGAIAGVMARTDVERGVWKAPAGLDANVRGILGLEAKLTDREQGILNKAGANVIRVFTTGTVVWGARTLLGTDDNPSEWKYVPIRRFALFLEETLFRGTKWVVFEPNDEPLWANIRKNIRAFMLGLFREGAFEGATPDEAFYVKCDGETTTATDRNLGIVNIEVGFAPLKPAEFVVIRIQQIANDNV